MRNAPARTTPRDVSSVFIFDTYTEKPVYHDYGRIKDDMDMTVCGLVMYDGSTRYAATLPRYRADLFANPCGKCFR